VPASVGDLYEYTLSKAYDSNDSSREHDAADKDKQAHSPLHMTETLSEIPHV